VQSSALRTQAREVVQYIADHTGDDELCALFLNSPAVSAVVN